MKSRSPIFLSICLLLGLPGIHADGSGTRQTLEIEPASGAGGGFNLFWPARLGRSYFIQRSEGLASWAYLPTVTAG